MQTTLGLIAVRPSARTLSIVAAGSARTWSTSDTEVSFSKEWMGWQVIPVYVLPDISTCPLNHGTDLVQPVIELGDHGCIFSCLRLIAPNAADPHPVVPKRMIQGLYLIEMAAQIWITPMQLTIFSLKALVPQACFNRPNV